MDPNFLALLFHGNFRRYHTICSWIHGNICFQIAAFKKSMLKNKFSALVKNVHFYPVYKAILGLDLNPRGLEKLTNK